ncbi:hypothetical protein LCGC14_2794670 [marine sediment metagenome]|uniref:Uncharacterized protein n=1 Tax=marine sediment metagenome TaxID=412755 RepID=A0A0F9BFV7_9ZZZZ
MATYVPAKKNTAFITYVGLPSQANALTLQANPTLANGDVKVAIDDGAPANLATLPVVDGDFTKRVKVNLSAGEMNGDNCTLIFSDAAGAEWCDQTVNLQTAVRLIDDLAFPTTTGRSIDVTATGAVGIDWGNIENPTTAVDLSGTDIQLCDTTTTNTDMVGTNSALLAASAPANFGDLAITVTTGRIDVGSWLGVAPNALISGRVDTDVAVVNTAAISTTSFAAGAVDASALAANVITSSELADSATPRILKNTALANFMFLMVDSTDHVTPKTGLTFGAGDSQRSLNGAAFANTANLPTEVGSGIYKVNLATTDLNADVVTFRFDGTAADSRLITILTQPV